MSRELILGMSMSVDGFVADLNDDISWMFATMSDEGREWVTEKMGQVSLIAVGRKSYEAFVKFWPTASMPMARAMNETPKAVFSRSGRFTPPEVEKTTDPTVQAALDSWLNPIVAGTDLVKDIENLKGEDGKPVLAIGGAMFGASLAASGLVDVFRLVVHPVAIGRGLPLFGDLESHLRLKLEEVKEFQTGAMVKTYRRA